jgi:hypothetical protein
MDPLDLLAIMDDPILALEVLMPGFKLPPHQEIMLRDFWRAEFCYSTSSRSTGKSALSGVALLLWCATHPGTKAGVLAQKFSSAKLVLEFIESLIIKYPQLQKCIVPTKPGDFVLHGPDKWEIKFTNGSTLIALPSDLAKKGARVRGFRFNVLLIDESVTIPYPIITAVFVPCCSIRDSQGNRKLIFTTTGGYKPSEHWDLCQRHYEEARKGNPLYAFWNFTYLDVPPEFSYIVDHAALKDLEETSDPGTVARELYGLWTEAGSGYFTGAMLERNRLTAIDLAVYPEITGERGATYIIGIDPAQRGIDHTALVVLKKIKDSDKWAVVASASYNFKRGWAEENARLVLDYMERFQPAYLAFDKNGGEQILQELKKYFPNPDDCPIDMTAEPWEPGKRICRLFVPSSTGADNNTRLNARLLQALDGNGNPSLLIPGSSLDEESLDDLKDMDQLQAQLISVSAEPLPSQPGLFRFSSPTRKDRYSALLYAWNAAKELVGDDLEEHDGGAAAGDDMIAFTL